MFFRTVLPLEGVVGFEPTIMELQSIALPLGYTPIMERVVGFEPASSAWKAEVLPLNDTRMVEMTRVELVSNKNSTYNFIHMLDCNYYLTG